MRVTILSMILSVFSFLHAQQNWVQVGPAEGNDGALTSFIGMNAITFDNENNIYVTARFDVRPKKIYVAKFDGNQWSVIGDPDYFDDSDKINHLVVIDDVIYAVGFLKDEDRNNYIAMFKNGEWAKLDIPGMNDRSGTKIIAKDNNNQLIAAGAYQYDNGDEVSVLRYTGSIWQPIALNGPFRPFDIARSSEFTAMHFDSNNQIHISVNEQNAKPYIVFFNGEGWAKVGGGNNFNTTDKIEDFQIGRNNFIYAVGDLLNDNQKNTVRFFNGNRWSQVHGENGYRVDRTIEKVAISQENIAYVAGPRFEGNFISKFENNRWSRVGERDSFPDEGDHIIRFGNDNTLYAIGQRNFNVRAYVSRLEDQTLAIDENSIDSAYSYWIDPVSQLLHFDKQFFSFETFTIYDISGKTLLDMDNATSPVDLSPLPSGMFIVKASSKKQTLSFKIVTR